MWCNSARAARLTWSVLVLVDPHHEHWRICRRRADDHVLGSPLDVSMGLVQSSEDTCTLNDKVY